MGDRVQKTLETLLPTLLELKAKQLFSDKEIKDIVRKRREFEYRLVGRKCSKNDLLDYIQYETALEALRKERAAKKGWKLGAVRSTSSLHHILRLFARSVRIWPQDKRLWNQYIDFCFRSGSTKRVLSVLLEALAHHPRELSYWLLAADRELQLGHLEAPRRLMQLALRQLPDSRRLWEEYFKFEVKCALRQATTFASEESEEKVGLRHLLVLIKGALAALTKSDRCCFVAYALDLMSTVWSPSLTSYFNGLDDVECELSAILEQQAQSDSLMSLFRWKLQMLSRLKQPKTSIAVDAVLDSLTTLENFSMNEWCAVILFFCNVMSVARNSNRGDVTEDVTKSSQVLADTSYAFPSSYAADDALFSLSVDPEDKTTNDPETIIQGPLLKPLGDADLFTSYATSQMLEWAQGTAPLLYRCLVFPTPQSPGYSVPCLRALVDNCSSTSQPDTFVCRRLRAELDILSSVIFRETTPQNMTGSADTPAIHHIVQWLVNQTLSRDAAEWAQTIPILMCLIREVCSRQSFMLFSETVLHQLEDSFETDIPDIQRLHLGTLRAELSLLLNRNDSQTPLGLPHYLAELLSRVGAKSSSRISFELLSRIIFVGEVWLLRRTSGTVTLQGDAKLGNAESPSYALDTETFCRRFVFWVDTLYSVCPLPDLPALTTAILRRWIACSPEGAGQPCLASEWSRVMFDSSFAVAVIPVGRQIIKRLTSIAIIADALTRLVVDFRNAPHNLSQFYTTHCAAICRYFRTVISSAAEFDRSLAGTPNEGLHPLGGGTNCWFLGTIPESISLEALATRYMSVVLALDAVRSIPANGSPTITTSSQSTVIRDEPLSEIVIRELTPLLRSNPGLAAVTSMRLAKQHLPVTATITFDEGLEQEVHILESLLAS